MKADTRERTTLLPLLVLAVAVYVPLIATAPGRVGADTKSYLYLDPARLLSRAWSMWDPSIGLGTVSHQTIGYLWPMGPWFWAAERLGLPDWLAQRLWLGTILFAAGAGVLWLLRTVLGWRTAAATVAAFSYALTPYVLTLASRLSAILLPFAGLPWLLGLTILALRRGGWRHPALFALVVATVGSVNATALVLVGLAPLWWLLHARLTGAARTRDVLATTGRIAALTVAANAWWLAGLWAQGGWGIEILQYTETAKVVATASNAAEVLRGLGYWFFYGGDRLGPWIEPSVSYTQRLALLALTFALPLAALVAASTVRFRQRSYFVGLAAIGTVVAVGAHPWDDPPPFGEAVKAFVQSDVGLAMRSLPRAAPLVALGLAACLGAGVEAAAAALADRPRWRRVGVALPAVAVVATYAALPPLWTGKLVADNLDRPEDLPSYWDEVAAYVDRQDHATRVLEIPGSDFASYRWGNTVDPITPGLVDRPYAARELIPYGTPASADLLAAIDRRLQEDTLEPGTLAAVARLLGAGEVVVRDDLQFERYRTPRPYVLSPLLAAEPGLGASQGFGAPVVNQPVPEVPLLDEQALARDDGAARPPVEIHSVDDPEPIVRTRPEDVGVVVAGDGEGLVDAAAAGLVDGRQLVRYGASLGAATVAEAVAAGDALVITDGNRVQGRRWSTVRDILGAVEPPGALVEDLTDNRLPLFPDAEDGWTTTVASGSLSVAATSYGNPISFTPEYRPAYAADGDITTEWRTGASSDVRGERLELRPSGGSTASSIRVVQQLSGARNRHITEIAVRLDDGQEQRAVLDERSLTPEGQVIDLEGGAGPFDVLSIEILGDSSGREPAWGRPVRWNGLTQVGFAEVELLEAGGASPSTDPALRLPEAATGSIGDDGDVALVLTRWRTEATDNVRADPERAIARQWSQPVERSFDLAGTARLSPRAGDDLLDAVIGTSGVRVYPSSRLTGVPSALASAAVDGDPATWWSPAFGDGEPSLTITVASPTTISTLSPVFVEDGRRSVPTRLRIEVDGADAGTIDLPPGGGTVPLPTPLTGLAFRFVVVGMAPRETIEWYSNAPTTVPPAIAELGIPELAASVPATFDTGCRDDLLRLDGEAIPVRITGSPTAALAGEPMVVEPCGGPVEIAAGDHSLASVPGLQTGVDIDQIVLRSGFDGVASESDPADDEAPSVSVISDERWRLRVDISGASAGDPFWLVLGQSHSSGWRVDGAEPELVDGYANGWLITPTAGEMRLELVWEPQQTVNRAIAASVFGILGCLLIVVLGHGSRRVDPSPAVGRTPVRRKATTGWRVTVVGAAAVGSLLVIGPLAALVVAVTAAVGAWVPKAASWIRFVPAAAYGFAALYIVGRQARSHPTAAFEWPAEQTTAHAPALVAVAVLLVLVALQSRDDRGRGDDVSR